jgi:hypothetical protein
VVAEISDLRADHGHQPERQQDGPLGPLVHDDLAGGLIDPGHPRLARVNAVHGTDDYAAGRGILRRQLGAAVPEFVQLGRKNRSVIAGSSWL